MSAEGVALDVNKMMIANRITARYSHADAAFLTNVEDHKPGSMLQARGICIQSKTYPAIGVVLEYQIEGDHITGVKHAMAVQGCKK
ncbi:hypothetical protein [Sulfitobacter sp. R18_1]|uniref:hypothetical protein n=1 Tax=Sulfitobacter sp. R18_1 TaxID=2821104 RepID=UPI001ADC0458|nr:hypothetical protein [Sulfitobacter sp. R18_1]MBO9428756.1 hypothetical protein [Sulfitobacter sp. R18_1]